MSHILNSLPIQVQIAMLLLITVLGIYAAYQSKKKSDKLTMTISILAAICGATYALGRIAQNYLDNVLITKILMSSAYASWGIFVVGLIICAIIRMFNKDLDPNLRRMMLVCLIIFAICVLFVLSIIIWSKLTA